MRWEIYNRQSAAEEEWQRRRAIELTRETARLEDRLIRIPPGQYDAEAAAFFAAASAWAYSDSATFAEVICRRRVDGPCVLLEIKNDALFVDMKAHLFQSGDGRLVVLAVRGTEPTNLINWLMNASVQREPFFEAGQVHGGFFRSAIVLWNTVKRLILAASRGMSLPAICDILSDPRLSCVERAEAFDLVPEDEARRMAALYTCGHSMGGALAALAGAAMHLDPETSPIADTLRGVYTFGQPMFCDPALADTLQAQLGDKVFRHNYERDLVPYLPPRIMGEFKHFGQAYLSSEDQGWVPALEQIQRQARSAILSITFGLAAWVKEQLPYLRWLRLPYSWADHAPLFYVRTSLSSLGTLGTQGITPGGGLL